jgi:hypothetical protein
MLSQIISHYINHWPETAAQADFILPGPALGRSADKNTWCKGALTKTAPSRIVIVCLFTQRATERCGRTYHGAARSKH